MRRLNGNLAQHRVSHGSYFIWVKTLHATKLARESALRMD